jgi:hypothetical protein
VIHDDKTYAMTRLRGVQVKFKSGWVGFRNSLELQEPFSVPQTGGKGMTSVCVFDYDKIKGEIMFNYSMLNGFRSVAIGFFIFMFTSNSNANQQSQICSEIHRLLILDQRGRAPADFFVEFLDHGGGGDIYPKLDIDGDGIDDSIVRGCGASIDALCSLYVKLSTGKQFELEDEERFFLARVKSNIYVIVGETSEKEKAKRGKRRIYQLTKQTIKLICPHV